MQHVEYVTENKEPQSSPLFTESTRLCAESSPIVLHSGLCGPVLLSCVWLKQRFGVFFSSTPRVEFEFLKHNTDLVVMSSTRVHQCTITHRPHSSVSRPFWRLCWLLDSDARPNLKYCSDLEMTAEQKPQYGYLLFHVNTCIAGRWRKRLSRPSKLFCFAYGSNWVYSGAHREQTVNRTAAFHSHTLRL